jgi:3-hydroxyacyl-[acyl-carrier-protein] dehydratase
MADKTMYQHILDLVPQQEPFRFIDEIIEINDTHGIAACRYDENAWFYTGHFPGNPVTPGVILIETMAQAGLVVMAIYQDLRQGLDEDAIRKKTTLFTLADEVEFSKTVNPGQRVIARSDMIYNRRGHLKCRVLLEQENGERICQGLLTGKGVDA